MMFTLKHTGHVDSMLEQICAFSIASYSVIHVAL